MIEYAMLIVLGFCMGGLMALLIAPTMWRRAVYLTKRRLEATLPMSLSDIEADKDLLRASYAVMVRRLETALAKVRDKSAGQLVEVSRLQMEIANLNDQIAMLHKQLEERSNAANVFEKTLKKRFPELEAQLATARAALEERAQEFTELTGKLRRSEEAQALARQATELQQSEIRQLREGLERSGVDRTGRFKKRSAQWTLEEFRSEHDRLSLELSKMREQLALSQKRENSQVVALKAEMQQLAERLITSASAREKHLSSPARNPVVPQQVEAGNSAEPLRPQHYGEQPLTAPQPWPKDRTHGSGTIGHKNVSSGPGSVKMQSHSSGTPDSGHTMTGGIDLYGQRKHIPSQADIAIEKDTVDVKPMQPNHFSSAGADEGRLQGAPVRTSGRMSIHAPAVAAVEGGQPAATSDTRAALKTLLNRTAKPFVKEGKEGADASFATLFAPVASEPADVDAGVLPSGPAAIPAGLSLASLAAQSDEDIAAEKAAEGKSAGAAVTAAAPEAQMDKMLREIFENRSSGNGGAGQATAAASAGAVSMANDGATASAGSSSAQGDASGGANSLSDRLRVFQG